MRSCVHVSERSAEVPAVLLRPCCCIVSSAAVRLGAATSGSSLGVGNAAVHVSC